MAWNPTKKDVLAVGYGGLESEGMVLCWSLKNVKVIEITPVNTQGIQYDCFSIANAYPVSKQSYTPQLLSYKHCFFKETSR
jgi:hypothetical protein